MGPPAGHAPVPRTPVHDHAGCHRGSPADLVCHLVLLPRQLGRPGLLLAPGIQPAPAPGRTGRPADLVPSERVSRLDRRWDVVGAPPAPVPAGRDPGRPSGLDRGRSRRALDLGPPADWAHRHRRRDVRNVRCESSADAVRPRWRRHRLDHLQPDSPDRSGHVHGRPAEPLADVHGHDFPIGPSCEPPRTDLPTREHRFDLGSTGWQPGPPVRAAGATRPDPRCLGPGPDRRPAPASGQASWI